MPAKFERVYNKLKVNYIYRSLGKDLMNRMKELGNNSVGQNLNLY